MADNKQSREVEYDHLYGMRFEEFEDFTKECEVDEFYGKKIVSCRKDGHPCCFEECEVDVEKPSKQSGITVTVTADVGEAISGFKALQRELRETTKAVR